MDQFQMDHQALYHLLKIKCERETLDDILQGMRTLLADEAMPTAEQVRAFLQAPDGDTALDPQQQMVAMDQMLQCMEVNFRTCCDLLRYQQMKKAGAVRDMDEFLDVLYPGNTEEEQDESVWVQVLRGPASVSQCGNGVKGPGHRAIVRLRASA